jgi:hypothetical protein
MKKITDFEDARIMLQAMEDLKSENNWLKRRLEDLEGEYQAKLAIHSLRSVVYTIIVHPLVLIVPVIIIFTCGMWFQSVR